MASREIILGTIPYTANQRSAALKLPVHDTLLALKLRLTGVHNVVTNALTSVVPDAPLTLARQIQLYIGGELIQSWGDNSDIGAGGKCCYYNDQIFYGYLPELVIPVVGVGANAISSTIVMPFAMPPALTDNFPSGGDKGTAILPTSKDIELYVSWGDPTSLGVVGAGTQTITACQIEVVGLIDSDLNAMAYPDATGKRTPMGLLYVNTKQASLSAGANANEESDIDRVGALCYLGIIGIDNSIRADGVFNNLKLSFNTHDVRAQGSWGSFKDTAKYLAGLQAAVLPVGVNFISLDQSQNGGGFVDTVDGSITAVKLGIDHAALTATFRALITQFNVRPQ
jgi:hypothetical protein